MDDWQLLNEYKSRNSEEAFRELVTRYAGMVYHVALRQLRNPHAAEEIAQAVFITLAQNAGRISRRTLLSGWLFHTTRFAVLNRLRSETNRQRHEQEAFTMQTITETNDSGPIWEQISPLLNDALEKLPEKDRAAVMGRYFEDKSYKDVAVLLGVSEDAAKVRIYRALEKLRVIFSKKGVALNSVALAAVFTAHGVSTLPAGLASSITAAAMGATSTTSTATFLKGTLKIMVWTKAKIAIVTGVVLVITSTVAIKALHRTPQKTSVASLDTDLKQEPGIKKFRAIKKVDHCSSGDSIIMGGWEVEPGIRVLVIVTPTMIDHVGNVVAPPYGAQSQVVIDTKFAQISEQEFGTLELQSVFNGDNDSKMALHLPPDEATRRMDSIRQSSGSQILSAPRVTTEMGRQANVSVQDTQMIAGKKQLLGPSLDVLATVDPDDAGKTLDIVLVAQFVIPAEGWH